MPSKHESRIGADKGLPDDWRYCRCRSEKQCAGCEGWTINTIEQVVERKVTDWRSPEHWHASCALERALWWIEKQKKEGPRLIKHKWKPKEPSR